MNQSNIAAKSVEAGWLLRGLKRLAYWLRPNDDGLTLLLTALVLLSVTWLLERAGWEENLPSLSGIAITALVLGFVLARSVIPPVVSHLIAGFSGVAVTTWLAAAAMQVEGREAKLAGLVRELASWGQAVVSDVIKEGNTEFIILLVGLFWVLGYLSIWHILRCQRAWGLVLPGGLVALIALVHLPEGFYFHFILYLVASVLLLVHVNLLRQQREWGLGKGGYHPLVGVARLSFVIVFGLAAVLVAWKMPPVQAAPLNAVTDVTRAPWEFVQDQFSRLFSALPAKKPFVTLHWGNSLAFGGPPQLSDQVLFTVESKQARYWRARVYDIYTPQGWRGSQSTTRLLNEELLQEGEPLDMRSRVIHSVRLNAATDTLFMAGEPVSSSLPAMAVTRFGQPADIFFVRSGTELRLSQKYSVTSSISIANSDNLRQANSNYPGWVTENYLQLPTSFPSRVRRLSRDIASSAATPYDKVIAIRDYLKTYTYNLNIKAPPPGRDGVDYFLFSQRAGYCDYYASAMVTMLRSVRVPARFMVGYAAGEWDNGKKVYVVRELHYHSWVEVYFSGYGWVEFEPTPPEAVEFTNQQSLSVSPPLEPDEEQTAGLLEDEYLEEAAGPTTILLRWTVIGGILSVVLFLILAWYRWWGRLARLGHPAEIYAKMSRLGSLARLTPQPQLTPMEYAERLSACLPGQAQAIRYIAEVYARTRYGQRKFLQAEEQDKLEQKWRRLRHALLFYLVRRRPS